MNRPTPDSAFRINFIFFVISRWDYRFIVLNDFDFTNKKIGFIKASIKQNKKIYFQEEKERFQNNSTIISSYLYIFDINPKKESGGYDAAIIYWSKFTIPIDKIVKILRENN